MSIKFKKQKKIIQNVHETYNGNNEQNDDLNAQGNAIET